MEVKQLAVFTGHTGSLYAVYARLGSEIVYTSGADGMIVRWNLANPDKGELTGRVTNPVYSLWLDEDSDVLLAGTSTGNLHLLDQKSRIEFKNLTLHTGGVFELVSSGDGIISGGADGYLKLMDSGSFDLLNSVQIGKKSIRGIAVNESANQLAVASGDASVYILDKNRLQLKQILNHHTNTVFSVAYSPDGKILLSGGRDAQLNFYEADSSYKLIRQLPAHLLHIHNIRVSPDGKLTITSSMDKTIKIWDTQSGELLKVIDHKRNGAHLNSINKVRWIDENRFISISDDKKMMLWKVFDTNL